MEEQGGPEGPAITEGAPKSERPLIFISYRIDFDHPIAVAVKRLIETSLDPAPEVFVSGDGGLRPSAQGFRPQLQRAIGSAKAFVGVITPASKEREWLFFEAGAAFGQSRIYTPLLVGVGPRDLADTIADYQAVLASDKEAMYRLMEVLADAVGAAMKPQFSRRYLAFQRALQVGSQKGEEEEEVSKPERDLVKAARLLASGDVKAAEELLAPIEQSPDTSDVLRTEVKVMRIVARPDRTPAQCLEELDGCDEQTKASPAWQFWTGAFEPMPGASVERLKNAWLSPEKHHWKLAAVVALHRRLVALGRVAESLDVARWGLRHQARRVRSASALMLGEARTDLASFLRVLLLLHADLVFPPQVGALGKAVDLALEARWPAFAMFLAVRLSQTKDDSHLQLGRAYHAIELPSLAYREYKFAVSRGMSAMRLNLALLLKEKAPAAAVLEQLDSYPGPIVVDDSTLPHRLRAEAERQVQQETAEATAIAVRGEQTLGKLLLVLDRCVQSDRASSPLPPKLRDPGGEAILEKAGEGKYVVRPRGGRAFNLECPLPFLPLWVSAGDVRSGWLGRTVKPVWGMYEQLASGDLAGVLCQPSEKDPAAVEHQWQVPRN